MQRIRPLILAVVLLALAGSAARADGSAGAVPRRSSAFSLGLFGGGHRFADEANLGVAASPGATAGARSHGLAGLRAAIEMRPWAAVEVEAFGMRTRDRTYDRPASIVGYRLNTIAYLIPGDLRPFALVGAGVLEVATTRAEGPAGLVRDRDGEFHVGVGLDYRLREHLAFRVDARAVQLPGKLVWSLTTNLEASLGVALVFGAGPRLGVAGQEAGAAMPTRPAERKPAPRETVQPAAVATVVPAPPSAGALAVPGAPALAPQPSEVDGEIAAPSEVPDLSRSPPSPPAVQASPPSPSTAGSPSPPSVAPEASRAPVAPRVVAPATAMPSPVAATTMPVPTIPGTRGRLPSIAELLGRSKEIRFDGSSSSKLSLVALPLIGQLAEAMAKAPDVQIEIVVHTAGSGNPAYDLALSKRRADAVKRSLVEREVRASRLLSTGRGSADPLAPSVTRSGRRLNERVELRVWTPEKMVR